MNFEEYMTRVETVMARFGCTAVEAAQIASHHYGSDKDDEVWEQDTERRRETSRVELEIKKKELAKTE